jgi:putative ABC transport system ATP-binding protein
VSTLELLDVVKHYRVEKETVRAIDGVTLAIDKGEFVGLYGPSGSGKTTLLLLVAAVDTPDRGAILFDGIDLKSLSAREKDRYRGRDVGFVLQSAYLTPRTPALDNATIKLTGEGLTMREARRRARPWLDRLGLGNRAEHTPEQLSMGERQRVSIARALVNEPRLLLADEPTGYLDSKRSRETLALMRDICHERQIPGLLVTHDPDAAQFLDRVHTLSDGRLADDSTRERTTTSW